MWGPPLVSPSCTSQMTSTLCMPGATHCPCHATLHTNTLPTSLHTHAHNHGHISHRASRWKMRYPHLIPACHNTTCCMVTAPRGVVRLFQTLPGKKQRLRVSQWRGVVCENKGYTVRTVFIIVLYIVTTIVCKCILYAYTIPIIMSSLAETIAVGTDQ